MSNFMDAIFSAIGLSAVIAAFAFCVSVGWHAGQKVVGHFWGSRP